jgi:hypothetical protein
MTGAINAHSVPSDPSWTENVLPRFEVAQNIPMRYLRISMTRLWLPQRFLLNPMYSSLDPPHIACVRHKLNLYRRLYCDKKPSGTK